MTAPSWDLTQVFVDDEAAIAAARSLPERAAVLAERAGPALGGGGAPAFLAELGELEADLDHVRDYARMRQYGDAVGVGVQLLVVAVDAVTNAVRTDLERALDAWRGVSPSEAEAIAGEPALAAARYRLDRARSDARHRLSADAERAWSARSESARDRWTSLQEQVESAARATFDDGTGEREWGIGDLSTVLRRPDPELRARAYDALAEGAAGIVDVLAIAWDASVADRLAEDRIRGRDHPAQETLDAEGLSRDGLESLVDVASSGFGERRVLLRALGSSLGMERLAVADADAEPPGLPTLGYEQVVDLAVAGQALLAPALANEARLLPERRRIDAETRPGKQNYAVTFRTSLTPPAFVAFRYTGQAANVPLLGHELGHAVALGRSHAAQPPLTRGWPGVIFEVPSMSGEIAAGEVFAAEYPESARAIRIVSGQDLAWAAFEAIAFCRVELDLYAARAEGAVLDAPLIQAAFARHFGELYEPDIPFDDRDALVAMAGWAGYAIPFRFYNFQYAVGALVSLALAARRREDPERFSAMYLELLEAGRSASPADQLRPFGLELGARQLWELGLGELHCRFAAL